MNSKTATMPSKIFLKIFLPLIFAPKFVVTLSKQRNKEMSRAQNGLHRLLHTEVRNGKNEVYEFEIEFYIFKEDDNYIAYCPMLDLSTAAKSIAEAEANFNEMFQLYVESCLDNHTLQLDLIAHRVV
jgi:predicted RNase H-like HicB family nuclease